MKRREVITDRPPIPDKLGPFRMGEWLTAAERLDGDRAGDGVKTGVKAYRRWQRARAEWAAENGYTAHEMHRAAHPPKAAGSWSE